MAEQSDDQKQGQGLAQPRDANDAAAGGGGTARKGGTGDTGGKVGSDPAAAANFAERQDFGTPVDRALPRGRGSDAAEGLPRQQTATRGDTNDRTVGAGSAGGGPGAGSGGDIDTDFIGLGAGGTGLAQSPPTGVTTGPASSTGSSDEFASGPPAAGRNQPPRGQIGGAPRVAGSTVDHGGGDASTVGPGRGTAASAIPLDGADGPVTGDAATDDAAAGELSLDEAGGADNAASDNR